MCGKQIRSFNPNVKWTNPQLTAKEQVLQILQVSYRTKAKAKTAKTHSPNYTVTCYIHAHTDNNNNVLTLNYNIFYLLLSFFYILVFWQGSSVEVSFLAQCSWIIPSMQHFSSPLTLTEQEVALSLGIELSRDTLILVGNTIHIHLCM